MIRKDCLKIILWTICVGVVGPSFGQQQKDVLVYSTWGEVKSTSDARNENEEAQIISEAVRITIPHLKKQLYKVSQKVVYNVDHEWIGITKTYMGFSAEDDPKYQYPDRTFFHPHNKPEGTIKVNFTEKFVQAAEFLLAYAKDHNYSPQDRSTALNFVRSIVAHEILHAWQYHTKPVPDFERNIDLLKDHEYLLIKGHRKKIDYEKDAMRLVIGFFKTGELESLAASIKIYMEKNPEIFEPGGKYSLLHSSRKNPFVERYLLEFAQEVRQFETGAFGITWIMTYEGQIRPVEIAYEARKLKADTRKSAGEKAEEAKKLKAELEKFTQNDFWKTVTSVNFGYLPAYAKSATDTLNELIDR